ITRQGDLAHQVTVSYTVSGTATPSEDYAPLQGYAVFQPGDESVEVTVTPIARPSDGTETVVLTLNPSNSGAYTVGGADHDTVFIDDVYLPEIGLVASTPQAAKSGGPYGVVDGVFT